MLLRRIHHAGSEIKTKSSKKVEVMVLEIKARRLPVESRQEVEGGR
jgi:hypothetical protein